MSTFFVQKVYPDLENKGLNAELIYALPVTPGDTNLPLFDTLHTADGVSIKKCPLKNTTI